MDLFNIFSFNCLIYKIFAMHFFSLMIIFYLKISKIIKYNNLYVKYRQYEQSKFLSTFYIGIFRVPVQYIFYVQMNIT